MFAWQNAPGGTINLPGLQVSPAPVAPHATSKFDLALSLEEAGDKIVGGVEYATALFERATVERYLGYFRTLLEGMVAEETQAVDRLPLLPEAERRQLVYEWNATQAEYPREKLMHELYEEQAEETPDAVAVVFEDTALSYGDLNRQANQLAHYLRKLGVGPDGRVAICTERGLEMMVGLLGVFKAGGAYVPLDPAYPPERLRYMLNDSAPAVLLTQRRWRGLFSGVSENLPALDLDDVAPQWRGWPETNPVWNRIGGDSRSLAYLIYTSGSTGAPKGAMVEQGGMVNHLYAKIEDLHLTAQDVVAQTASQCFDISVWQFLAALMAGGQVLIVGEKEAHDPEALLMVLDEAGVTVWETVPSMLEAMVGEGRETGVRLRGMRWVVVTGEACPVGLCRRWTILHPAIPMLNAYGPTECSDDVTHYAIREGWSGDEMMQAPIGQPLRNAQVYVLERGGEPAPVGVVGELYIGGEGVGRGYWKRAELTAERFVVDRFSGQVGRRLYRTGDVARWGRGGDLEFLGRIDDQIKIRGYRIELGEIEARLAEHAKVREAVVIARDDTTGDKRLVAYVVGRSKEVEAEDSENWKTVSGWQSVFEQVYRRKEAEMKDELINLRVWISSYTGEPFGEEEILDCVENTVRQVLDLKPKRVLEIGCGTGLILARVAPHCEEYYGTDISGEALGQLQRYVERSGLGDRVKLLQQAADDLGGAPREHFDLVVLNEVVQYFPSLGYLLRVLDGVRGALAKGGRVYLGDIRNFDLLEAFHTSVELHRANGEMRIEELRPRIQRKMRAEKELLLAPGLFTAMQQESGWIQEAVIELKGGSYNNEFTKFRYDVALHTTRRRKELEGGRWQEWEAGGWSVERLRTELSDGRDELAFTGVPNAKVARDLAGQRWLALAVNDSQVSEAHAKLAEMENEGKGIDPEELREIGREFGYEVCVSWPSTGGPGCYEALLRRATQQSAEELPVEEKVGNGMTLSQQGPGWSQFANRPLAEWGNGGMAVELRAYLQERLPGYMVPVAYIEMEKLPLTPNGKIDRKALPAPEGDAYGARGYEEPQGGIERALAEIWAEVLKLERVGRHDNFFELGGHSLLAVRVMARLRQTLGVEVGISELFAHSSVAGLAQSLGSAARAGLPAVRPMERPDKLPLSFAQQRLWFLAQIPGVSHAYHIPMGLSLRGELDLSALRRALGCILERHEALRTSFVVVDGEPAQRIAPPEESRFLLLEYDLREQRDGGELDRLLAEESRAPFDLEAGPLIRGRLIRQGEEEYALLITMHHIVSDGWSMGVFLKELSALYAAFVSGGPAALPKLEAQYADYTLWQRKWMEGEALQRQAEYWEGALAGAPALLELPADHPRPAQQDHAGAILGVALDEGMTAGLKALSRRCGTTMFMTLLAGWAALMARLSGQQDVVIGAPVANRNQVEIEGLIGFFVNTLALRVDVSGEPTVGVLLERVKRQVIAAQEHQDIPFEQVVELARPVRSLSHSPVFQVMFAWQNAPGGTINLPGLQVSPAPVAPHAISKFDLTLSLQEAGDKIVGGVEYATALFERATVERYLGYFRTLLQAMASDDTQEVGRLHIIPEHERRQVLYEWNATDAEYPREKRIHELFEEQAQKRPGAVVVVYENDFLSYAELNRRANQLAHYLRELGVKPDARVAICVERSLEMVIGLLAILKAGGAYVPLDPTYPAERLRFMLADSAPVAFLTQKHLQSLFEKLSASLLVIDISDAPGWRDQPESNPDCAAVELTSEHLACVIYTSGSTGTPKGVMVQHRGITNLIHDWTTRFRNIVRQDGIQASLWTSIGFDVSIFELFAAFSLTGIVNIVPEPVRVDSQALLEWLIARGVAFGYLPPFFIREAQDAHVPMGPLPLELVLVGVEPLVESALYRLRRNTPRLHIVNGYGPTETTVFSTTYAEIEDRFRNAPIGRPIGNTRIYILDGNGEPVPVGLAGELYIGGAGVARGYLNRPELTAERFLGDPFLAATDARMYKTGDLGRWLPDGTIEFLGRNDFQVKIRGFRIEPGEIKARLLEHEAVREAVVIAREDTPGDKRLVAYYTTAEQAEGVVGAEALRTHLSAKLPEYMLPAAYVRLESLPLTPNGKLDRKALPAPEADAYLRRGYEAPQGEVETLLAAIWAELLKLERVGRHDNFFELGGHSLLIQRVVNLLAQRGKRILVADLFEYPTPKLLADRIESGGDRTSSDGAICIRKGGPESPLFLAHDGAGVVFYARVLSQYLDPDIPVYGLPAQSADEPRLRTMEALARRMVRMIRTIRPRGPYRIAGWSFGGLMAYEIAMQLIGVGEEVEFLGLLDTPYPSQNWKAEQNQAAFDDKKILLLAIEGLCLEPLEPGTGEEQRLAFTELTSKSAAMEFDSLLAEAQRMSLLPRHWIDLTATQVRQILSRIHLFQLAVLGYSVQCIPIPVYLFLTEEKRDTAPFLGWSECLQEDQIRAIPTTGTHISMLYLPHVKALGQALSTAIRNVPKEVNKGPEFEAAG
jgi:amino acid adenylation domain-containing protein